jgi:hypothetical protein
MRRRIVAPAGRRIERRLSIRARIRDLPAADKASIDKTAPPAVECVSKRFGNDLAGDLLKLDSHGLYATIAPIPVSRRFDVKTLCPARSLMLASALLAALLAPVRARAQDATDVEAMLQAVDSLKQLADLANAPLLAPSSYASAMKNRDTAIKRRERGEKPRQYLSGAALARDGFAKSIEAAKIAAVALGKTLELRSFAVERRLDRDAAAEFARAERRFAAAVAAAEKGDLRSARSAAEESDALYRETIIAGYRDGPLKQAQRALAKQKGTFSRRESEELARSLDGIGDWMRGMKGREFAAAEFASLADAKLDGVLGALYPEFYRNLPDTLLLGEFVMKVVSYDDRGYWDFDDKTAKAVAGVADIRFDCGVRFSVPRIPGDARIMDRTFAVVETVSRPEAELSLAEARRIDPLLSPGDTIVLPIRPREPGRESIIEAKLDYIGRLDLLPAPGSVRVRFENATIAQAERPTKGRMTAGGAYHPAGAAGGGGPAAIGTAGFTILIDSLSVAPGGAVARARIGLPRSIVDGEGCGLATVDIGETAITPRCELYKEMPSGRFGPFVIDPTGMIFRGYDYIIDLSSARSPSGLGLDPEWRGMVLKTGWTVDAPSRSITSNTGYLRARYDFANAIVIESGIKARFTLRSMYSFNCLVPCGYSVELRSGFLEVDSSAVAGGAFDEGLVLAPRRAVAARREPSTFPLRADFANLAVRRNLDLAGPVTLVQKEIFWGELTRAGEERIAFAATVDDSREGYAWFYLPGGAAGRFVPGSAAEFDAVSWHGDIPTRLEERRAAGITIVALSRLRIFTPDIPGAPASEISFSQGSGCSLARSWLNIDALGVSGEARIRLEPMSQRLGNAASEHYRGNAPFDATFECEHEKAERCVMVQWSSSAVHDSELGGALKLGGPSAATIPYRDLELTSTAGLVGGKIDLGGGPVVLDYWGVELAAGEPSEPAGALSVKTGQIIFTQAGIRERRHFDEPFALVWGEMLADGNIGELFFDYNSANQRFDGFLFTPHRVALSRHVPGTAGYLHVCGDNHFGFFGSKRLSIRDAKYSGDDPLGVHWGREVTLFPRAESGCEGSDLRLEKNWGTGLSTLDFEIAYDANDQDGFLGEGTVLLPAHFERPLPASIQIDRRASSIGFMGGTGSNFVLEAVDVGSASEVWGCIRIEENTLECMTIGFTLESAAQSAFGILGGAGEMIEAKLVVEPNVTTFSAAGLVYLYLSLGGSVTVNGSILLIADRGEGSVFGDFQGEFDFGSLFAGFEANGHVNWFLSRETQYLQGRAGISVYGRSLGSGGVAGGIFIGNNVPKSAVWVMTDTSNKFAVNMASFPERITGVYGFGYADFGFDVGLFAGGIEIFAGVGVFLNMTGEGLSEVVGLPLPYVLANVGVGLHGEILWGLVSASAWVNLQMMLGDPFYFQGSAGLEGCVLWVICASVDVTVRLDGDGFDIY